MIDPREPELPPKFEAFVLDEVALRVMSPTASIGPLFGMSVGVTVCQRHPEVPEWIKQHYPAETDPAKWISLLGMTKGWWQNYMGEYCQDSP